MDLTGHQSAVLARFDGLMVPVSAPQEFLGDVAQLAATLFEPLDVQCSITLHTFNQFVSVAHTSPTVEIVEELQNHLDGSPALNSLLRDASTVVDDTSSDERWPEYLGSVAQHGYGSILSVCLITTKVTRATMNFYAHPIRSFTPGMVHAAEHFASHAARRLRGILRTPTLPAA